MSLGSAFRLACVSLPFLLISAAVAQEFSYVFPEGGLKHGRPTDVSPSGFILGEGSEFPIKDPRPWVSDGSETTYLRSDLRPEVINSQGRVAGWYKGRELFVLDPGERHQRVSMLRGVNYARILGLTDSGALHLYGEKLDEKTNQLKRAGFFVLENNSSRWERAPISGRSIRGNNVLGTALSGASGYALLSSTGVERLSLNFVPTRVSSNGIIAGYRRATVTNPRNNKSKRKVNYPFLRNAQGEQLQVPLPEKLGSYKIRSVNSSGHMIISFKKAYAPAKSAIYLYEPGGVARELSTLAGNTPPELAGFTGNVVIGIDDAGTIVGYGYRTVQVGAETTIERRGYLLKRK